MIAAVHRRAAMLAGARDERGERHIPPSACNGYEGEWRELYDLAIGDAAARYPLSSVVDDMTFAISS